MGKCDKHEAGSNEVLFLKQSILWQMKERSEDRYHIRLLRFTSEPDSAASEASPGAHDLPSLATADMVGLVHHIR